MDVQLTLNEKQALIDIFSDYYSSEDIFAIGRLIGIDKTRYYGFGMNAVQLAEAFINCLVQNEKVQDLYQIIMDFPKYYRSTFEQFIQNSREKSTSKVSDE